MRAKNLGNHSLGSRGYPGKKPKWEKLDAALETTGTPNPFTKFKELRKHDYVRGRYKYNENTEEWVTDDKMKQLEEELVIN
jgi:hypothetical protein